MDKAIKDERKRTDKAKKKRDTALNAAIANVAVIQPPFQRIEKLDLFSRWEFIIDRTGVHIRGESITEFTLCVCVDTQFLQLQLNFARKDFMGPLKFSPWTEILL